MIKMASLKSGVLQKLYEEMKTGVDKASVDDSRPLLLQIRSIIPVLEEGALWPNRGFFLKVSDASHALYVSLSKEQNEMVLGNKWKLGQFIYVQKLEKANPVPLLKGVTAIRGRRPCEGTPVDIVPPADLVKLLEASAIDSVVEKGVILEKRVSTRVPRRLLRGSSDSESSCRLLKRHLRPARRDKVKIAEKKSKSKFNAEDCDNDSDTERSMGLAPKRRSWDQSDMLKVKESLAIVKQEIKLPPRSRSASANASPAHSVKSDSSDENTSPGVIGSGKELVESLKEGQVSGDIVNTELSDSFCSLVQEKNGAEAGISWKSLSPNLVEFGKEVVKQRDIAVAVAVNALQEACVSERLLNSLSTLSQLDMSERDDLEPYVDKFFELQDDLARTRSIIQSLTSINSASRTTLETESCTDNSIEETLERSKNAMVWIKSAIAVDLSPIPSPDPSTNPTDTAQQSSPSSCSSKTETNPMDTIKQSSPSNSSNKPESPNIFENNTTNSDTDNNNTLTTSSFEKEGLPREWIPGSTLQAAVDLSESLQDECKNLFLSHVDSYLDEVEIKISSTELDGRLAATMYKVKMVSDCLDMIMNKDKNTSQEGKRDGSECLNDLETEAYGRVRNKIYRILLKHVERTAMAFNRLNAASCECRDNSC